MTAPESPDRASLPPLLAALSGGDRRSIGAANRVAADVLRQPDQLAVLFQGMLGDDAVLRARCADAAEKVTARRPDLLVPFKSVLLGPLAGDTQAEIRWHLAPMLARLPLDADEEAAVVELLLTYTNDTSRIVVTLAMQALADLALRNPALRVRVYRRLAHLVANGSPAIKARGRKLLAGWPADGEAENAKRHRPHR